MIEKRYGRLVTLPARLQIPTVGVGLQSARSGYIRTRRHMPWQGILERACKARALRGGNPCFLRRKSSCPVASTVVEYTSSFATPNRPAHRLEKDGVIYLLPSRRKLVRELSSEQLCYIVANRGTAEPRQLYISNETTRLSCGRNDTILIKTILTSIPIDKTRKNAAIAIHPSHPISTCSQKKKAPTLCSL